MKKSLLLLLLFFISNCAFASMEADLDNTRKLLSDLTKEKSQKESEKSFALSKQKSFELKAKSLNEDFTKKNNEYLKVSSPDLIKYTDDRKLSEMRIALQAKQDECNSANDSLKQYKNMTEQLSFTVNEIIDRIAKVQVVINNIQADLFDQEMLKEVWSEGYAEEFLTKDRTQNDCERIVRSNALRDASEKAGKLYLESFSKVKDYISVEDKIISKTKVNTIDEDVAGFYSENGNKYQYGQIIKVPSGETFKFSTRVKIKVKGIPDNNPFRQSTKTKLTDSKINDYEIKYKSDDAMSSSSSKSFVDQIETKNRDWGVISKTLIYSIVVPGSGQYLSGRTLAANSYFWLTAASVTYYLLEYSKYNTKLDDYDKAYADFEKTTAYDLKIKKASEVNSIKSDLGKMKATGEIILYATAGVYLMNVLDVLIFTDTDKQNFTVVPKIDNEKIGLTLSWRK